MKLKLLPLAIASVAMVLFSCQSSVNIAKKRYSNGYYVSVSHNVEEQTENKKTTEYKKDLSAATKEVKMESAPLAEPLFNMEVRKVESTSVEIETANVSESKTITASAEKTVVPNKKSEAKKLKKESKSSALEDISEMTLLLIILCFIIPPVAVGLATNWEITPLVINILLTFLFWLPGVIHALIVVLR